MASSVVGQTKIRAISSQSGPAAPRTLGTSAGESQFVIAASDSVAASLTICGRSAASASVGGTAGGGASRKPSTANVSYRSLTFSPANAARRNRSTSRERWYGESNSMSFHCFTTTGVEVPTPSMNRPGARSASVAAVIARQAGPLV